jgi:hypothetical protein
MCHQTTPIDGSAANWRRLDVVSFYDRQLLTQDQDLQTFFCSGIRLILTINISIDNTWARIYHPIQFPPFLGMRRDFIRN